MADEFDPYYVWLGIPPEDQPADHYRLLGIRCFEENAAAISSALDQRTQFLRSLQVGKRSPYSQTLLNEISAAGGCLLDPKRKANYDQQLRRSSGTQATVAPSASTLLPVPLTTQPAPRGAEGFSQPVDLSSFSVADSLKSLKPTRPTSRPALPVILGGAIATGASILLLVVVVAMGGFSDSSSNEQLSTNSVSPAPSSPAEAPNPAPSFVPKNPPAPAAAPPLSVPENSHPALPMETPPAIAVQAPPTEVPERASPASAWQYGMGNYDPGDRSLYNFKPFAQSAGDYWQVGPAMPDPGPAGWLRLEAQGGHPGSDWEHSAVRRWTAPAAGKLIVTGRLRHDGEKGDGIRAHLASSRAGSIGDWRAFGSQQDTNAQFDVEKGHTIDFIVDCADDWTYDQFVWTVNLRLLDESGELLGSWDSERDFTTANLGRQ